MTHSVFLTILIAGFAISFFHASIPTHWLPFILAARAQKWTHKKTLAVTLLAGAGHVLMTTFLGVLIVWVGLQFDQTVGRYFSIFAASVLWLMGIYYILRYLKGRGHSHIHLPFISHRVNRYFQKRYQKKHMKDLEQPLPDYEQTGLEARHEHESHQHKHCQHRHISEAQAEGLTILGLFALLTFSPCEGFLPVYVSGISFGWTGFLMLTIILGIATLSGMIFFTWLAFKGIDRLNIQFLEKYEALIMGSILAILGIIVLIMEN